MLFGEEASVEDAGVSRSKRLVATHIVVENFKSYYGRHIIGPFHKVPNCTSDSQCVVIHGDCRTEWIGQVECH